MCQYKCHDNGEDTPCQLQHYFSLSDVNNILPIDDKGYCIFHSENIEWKQNNGFSDYLDKLLDIIILIDAGKINYETPWKVLDPDGLFYFDLRGITWIAKTSSDEKGNVIPIKNLSFIHHIVLNMHGGHFYDELEIKKINQTTFLFNHSIFEKKVVLKTSVLKEISFEQCSLNKGFYLGEHCEIERRAEFYNMMVQNDFSVCSSTFHDEVYFNDSTFHNDCIVSFDNVVFEERVNFSNCIFKDYTNIENCQFDGEVIFTDSEFDKETHMHSNEFDGNVYFKSNKDSNKMFNDICYLFVKDEELGAVIHFENINFSNIAAAEKEILFKLEKNNKVKIGKGCIKYRVQSPIININSHQINQNIITELTTSFSNYFLYSEGFNLGVEFVSKSINNLQLFYYTDELISKDEFISRLKLLEREYWNFTIDKNEKNKLKQIQAIDNYTSKISVLFKIGIRRQLGSLDDSHTKEIFKAISCNEEDISIEDIDHTIKNLIININNLPVKIGKLNVSNGGQVNIAEHIGKIEFNPNVFQGIAESDFNSLKNLLSELNEVDFKELQKIVQSINTNDNTTKMNSLKDKVLGLLKQHGIPISHSLTASGVFELLKNFFN